MGWIREREGNGPTAGAKPAHDGRGLPWHLAVACGGELPRPNTLPGKKAPLAACAERRAGIVVEGRGG